jgi:hypothetical protein
VSKLVLSGDTSGSVTLDAPAVSGTTTLTLPTTSGTVLTNGINTNFPAGSVLQVVSTTKTDFFSTASSSYVDATGVSASITPSSLSNKILVTITGGCGSSGNPNGFAYGVILRGSTQIGIGDSRGSAQRCSLDLSLGTLSGTGIQDFAKPFAFVLLDSPSTTSSVTYKLQVKATVASIGIGGSWSTADGNRSNIPTIITLMEIKG